MSLPVERVGETRLLRPLWRQSRTPGGGRATVMRIGTSCPAGVSAGVSAGLARWLGRWLAGLLVRLAAGTLFGMIAIVPERGRHPPPGRDVRQSSQLHRQSR